MFGLHAEISKHMCQWVEMEEDLLRKMVGTSWPEVTGHKHAKISSRQRQQFK